MKNLFYILTLLFSFSSFALANKCELSLEANGMMQYSTDKITIESDSINVRASLMLIPNNSESESEVQYFNQLVEQLRILGLEGIDV